MSIQITPSARRTFGQSIPSSLDIKPTNVAAKPQLREPQPLANPLGGARSAFKPAPPQVSQPFSVSKAIGALGNWFSSAATAVKSGVSTAGQAARSFASDALQAARNGLSAAANTIKAIPSAVARGAAEVVHNVVNNPVAQWLFLKPLSAQLSSPVNFAGVNPLGLASEMLGDQHQKDLDGTLVPVVPTAPGSTTHGFDSAYFINGISTSFDDHRKGAEAVANGLGMPVTGIFNSSEGMLHDLDEAMSLKMGIGRNPAVESTKQAIRNALASGKPALFVVHSEGGLIFSRALQDLQKDPTFKGDLSQLTVATAGAAADHYPDGPKYIHTVNTNDMVPTLTGLGPTQREAQANGGAGARVDYFQGPQLLQGHDFDDVYLPRVLQDLANAA